MNRLLKSLKKILRLKKYTLNDLRQQLGFVQQQIQLRYYAVEKIKNYVNTERLIATININGGATFSYFLSHKLIEIDLYEKEIKQLQETNQQIEEKLLDVYKDYKRFEKIQEEELKTLKFLENHRESNFLDEVATKKFLNI